MKNLYRPVTVPYLEIIQHQLLDLLPIGYEEKEAPFAFNVDKETVAAKCPKLVDWIVNHSKVDVLHYRIYVTPPNTRLQPHIDGGGITPTVPFRLNIPITGTQGTRLVFFKTPFDNLKTEVPKSYLSSMHPVNYAMVRPIDSLEVVSPHFVNTSVLHGVKNPTKNVRVMFVVTWLIDNTKYREIDEVFQIDI